MLPLDADHCAPTLDGASFAVAASLSQLERPLKSQGAITNVESDIRALTLAIRRGDADGFSRFYDLYSFRLYRFLLVLARGDENKAQEICQAVLIKLAKRFEVFDEERALWAWLCTLAKNTFIDHYRAEQRRNKLVSFEDLAPSFSVEADAPQDLSEILREALAALMPEERELIQAAYIDERPLQELAGVSGQTYKAVESRLARLRQKLKKQLLTNLRHEHEP
jgi:RNA polymerase sigma-70 factor (ECF subfamily)